ncbi:MAG: hypothetical protein PHV59_06250 [Victivallales bacterium]|nr:hypothetical protein [Victivallales bacterium]
MKLNWWQKPIRMMRRDFLGDFSYYQTHDLDEMAREARDKWHVNCEWVMATPGCAPGMAHLVTFNSSKFGKVPGLGDFDVIRAYMPHARKYGIRLVPYINQHWYSYDFAARYPEYTQQQLADGTPYGRKYPLYGNGTTFCVNSPWREFAFELIRETIRLGVDGCFLDGPVIFPNCCYCEHCRKLFKEQYGFEIMPVWADWNNKAWKPFLKFRQQSSANFLKDAQQAVKQINPEAVIFLNGGGFAASGVITARNAARMEKYQNFTGAEEFYQCSESYRSPFKTLNLGRFLAAGENPGVVFTHHTMSSWHYVPLSRPEMTLAMTQTVASGANTWFAIFMETMKYRREEAFEANKIQKFFADNEEFFTATESAAETAVLTSADTLYGYISGLKEFSAKAGSGKEENLIADIEDSLSGNSINEQRAFSEDILNNELHGCFDMANFSHVPLKVLWDEHITKDKLKNVSTLILPNSACLSDRQLEVIMEYVNAGGTLAAFFESGFYDENGNDIDRTAWLEFLGIKKVAGAFIPANFEEYMLIYREKFSPNITQSLLIPRTRNALKIVSLKNTEILGAFMNPVGACYAKLNGVSDYPAIIQSCRGKGKVIYCAGTLFDSFTRFHLDDHLQLFTAIVKRLSRKSRLQIETDAPGSLGIEIRQNVESIMVHLLNATGDMKRPSGTFIPLQNIHVSIRCRESPKSVKALRGGWRLQFMYEDGFVRFELPEIQDYELVVLTGRLSD